MRLLNTRSLSLEHFEGTCVPRYATFSHAWETDEASYEDMVKGTARSRKGFLKVQVYAEQAKQDGCNYAWIASCCIDRRNSAELSDAINSMYAWYQNAAICYSHLSDFDFKPESARWAKLGQGTWLDACWTVQELLASQGACGKPTRDILTALLQELCMKHDAARLIVKTRSATTQPRTTQFVQTPRPAQLKAWIGNQRTYSMLLRNMNSFIKTVVEDEKERVEHDYQYDDWNFNEARKLGQPKELDQSTDRSLNSLQIDTPAPRAMIREDMIICCTSLMDFLRECEHNFSIASTLLTCVLNGIRPLHKLELKAVIEISRLDLISIETGKNTFDVVDQLLELSTSLFVEDHSGYIRFKLPSMYNFLHSFGVDDIDSSHTTMASVCLLALQEPTGDYHDHGLNKVPGSAFVAYAQKYQQSHSRKAAASGLNFGIDSVDKQTCTDTGLAEVVPQRLRDLAVSDTDEDWISVN